jgi:6-pyruvoyltetrahydropterin/6-carboxytetrahydropterin synthase
MGHCLPEHDGKCYRPHGHRYAVEATVSGPLAVGGSSDGMVLDFGRLAEGLARVLDPFDHRFVMARHDPRMQGALALFGPDGVLLIGGVPTAENLAEMWARELSIILVLQVESVTVYETPNCWATWRAT